MFNTLLSKGFQIFSKYKLFLTPKNQQKPAHNFRNDPLRPTELFIFISGIFFFSLLFLFLFGYSFYLSDWQFVNKSFLMDNPFIYNSYEPNPVYVIGELHSFPMFLVVTFATMFEGLEAGFIIYFSVGIIRELHRMRLQMRPKTQRLHNEMNLMLFAQVSFFGGSTF